MVITEPEMSRLEVIHSNMNELLDEAEKIISGTNDYAIQNSAGSGWISDIRHALQNNVKIVTMEITISELWDELHKEKIL